LKRLSESKRINITLGDERGQKIMTESKFEQTREQIADTAHKASRVASAVVDALEDGVDAARHTAKRGCCAAAELLDDTKKRVQRYPIETVVATFAAGLVAGTAISWVIKRKHL
jgi:ABC-type transporter Mla subunit MlaD